jgi:hypothetical protein
MRGVFAANRNQIENKILDLELSLSRQGTESERKELTTAYVRVNELKKKIEEKTKRLAELEMDFHVGQSLYVLETNESKIPC